LVLRTKKNKWGKDGPNVGNGEKRRDKNVILNKNESCGRGQGKNGLEEKWSQELLTKKRGERGGGRKAEASSISRLREGRKPRSGLNTILGKKRTIKRTSSKLPLGGCVVYVAIRIWWFQRKGYHGPKKGNIIYRDVVFRKKTIKNSGPAQRKKKSWEVEKIRSEKSTEITRDFRWWANREKRRES